MNDAISYRSARPDVGEHAPYYGRYVAKAPDGDIVETLARELPITLAPIRALPEGAGDLRYAEGKWSIREVIGHLADAERVFAYRALRFARNDDTDLPGFDENAFVTNASFSRRTLASLCDEYTAVREASIALFSTATLEELERGGRANGARMTVRAAAWVIAGHEQHHRALLAERYLPLLG